MPDVDETQNEDKVVDELDASDPRIQAILDRELAGLRENKEAILREKREIVERTRGIQDQFEKLGGEEGINRLVKMRKQLEETELGKLLADGKHDEWYDKKTEALRASHTNQLEALESQRDEALEKANKAVARLGDKMRKADVIDSCTALGVIDDPGIREDIENAASKVFVWDPELDRSVIRDGKDGVVPGKDGVTPKTVAEWLEERKKDRRHWWAPSRGVGFDGGTHIDAPTDDEVSGMTMAEYREFRKKKGMSSGYGLHTL